MSDVPFWGPDFASLQSEDPEIADVVLGELERQRGGLQLIASENFTSPAVLAALGSTLTNKYAEGYPGRRYYGGCAEVDRAESIGIARAMALFQAEHANLQPHSGTSANLAAYAALVQPGDTVLAMDLPHGTGRPGGQGGGSVHPGRPADARRRGQGGGAARGGTAGLPAVRPPGGQQRAGARGRVGRRGDAAGVRGYRHPPRPDRPAGPR